MLAAAKAKAAEAAAAAKAKAADLDAKYDVTGKAGSLASSATATVKSSASSAGSIATAKVKAVTPEQRQQLLDGAGTVLSLAALVGGPKTKFAAAGVAMVAHNSAVSQPVARAGPVANAAADTIVEVIATAPGGQPMTIALESGEVYEVTVPTGVCVGQTFQLALPMPAPMPPPPPPPPPAAGGSSSLGGLSARCAGLCSGLGGGGVSGMRESATATVAGKALGISSSDAKQGLQVMGLEGCADGP